MESVEAAKVEVGKSATGGWETYSALIDKIRREWPRGEGTQEALDDMRR